MPYDDCEECSGSGICQTKFQKGFFFYNPGDKCPWCEERDEIKRRRDDPTSTMSANTDLDDRVADLEKRLSELERRMTLNNLM